MPAAQVIPFTSDLPWDVLGAVPEMLQTANGIARRSVSAASAGAEPADPRRHVVDRPGPRRARAAAGPDRPVRPPARPARTRAAGARRRRPRARRRRPTSQPRSASCTRTASTVPSSWSGSTSCATPCERFAAGGTVCFTGMLSDQWTIPEFYPMDWLPNGVRLTAYSGEAADLPAPVLQELPRRRRRRSRARSRSGASTASTRSPRPTATWRPERSAARASWSCDHARAVHRPGARRPRAAVPRRRRRRG